MANKFIKGLAEKLTMLAGDWFVIQPDAEDSIAYKIKKSNVKSDRTEPNTWYVNTNGDDANVGSDKFPFKTIQKAHDTAAANDTIIIQNIFFTQPSSPATSITKNITIKGFTANIGTFTRIRGTWTIENGADLRLENLGLSSMTLDGTEIFVVYLTNCATSVLKTGASRFIILDAQSSVIDISTPANFSSVTAYNSNITGDIEIGRGLTLSGGSLLIGNSSSGLDSDQPLILNNSTIRGDITLLGNLSKFNSVITGSETVSGTTTNENQLRKRTSPTIAADVLNIDFVDNFDFKTTAEVAATADFEITLSNDDNADIATIDLLITNTVIITLPSGSIMESTESRWVKDPTFELTIEGGTGESFELSLNKVGAKYKWVMSTNFE